VTAAGRDTPNSGWSAGSGIDITRPNPARRYNYWLGGKDNFEVDRISGDLIAKMFPTVPTGARENRQFMLRVGPYLARQGIRQFIDIGTGIPMELNLHQVVQGIAPKSRIVYVDNDPLVMAHARALMVSSPRGSVAYIQADLRDPTTILSHPELRDTLDLSQPIALLAIAVLHFFDSSDKPYGCMEELIQALPSNSYVVLTHADETNVRTGGIDSFHGPFHPRTEEQFAQFFRGLDLVEGGIASVVEWRPDDDPKPSADKSSAPVYAGVARKP